MKKNLYLFLFVFALLLVIFQYVNSKNIIEKYETDITSLKENESTYQNRIVELEDENLDLLYFNLENNDDALSYFERDGYDTTELIPFLSDELYRLNEAKGEHPLVPYASMTDRKMLINKVRLLNHKWIIADFSDGDYWGEMLLTYEITENRELKFKVVESLLYPPQQ
ncbi:MAG: hydrolase [Bacteroidia bacterium]|nr:hydrolase [Bacteroidia bacterium]NND53043.1 hydrolase [Flavobacteriaceae bacterium]